MHVGACFCQQFATSTSKADLHVFKGRFSQELALILKGLRERSLSAVRQTDDQPWCCNKVSYKNRSLYRLLKTIFKITASEGPEWFVLKMASYAQIEVPKAYQWQALKIRGTKRAPYGWKEHVSYNTNLRSIVCFVLF